MAPRHGKGSKSEQIYRTAVLEKANKKVSKRDPKGGYTWLTNRIFGVATEFELDPWGQHHVFQNTNEKVYEIMCKKGRYVMFVHPEGNITVQHGENVEDFPNGKKLLSYLKEKWKPEE